MAIRDDTASQARDGIVATLPDDCTLLRVSLAWFFSLCVLADSSALTIHSVSQSASQVGLYEPFTIQFGLSQTYSNPYDPDVVDAAFEFKGPSGITEVIPAFWVEQTPGWMARIVPLEIGPHSCRISVSDSAGQTATYDLTFAATLSDAQGFLRIDDRNPRYLRFDNGDPYLPVGHNLCWHGDDARFTPWLDGMAQAGANWTRYWMVPYVRQGIEWGDRTDYQLGTYSQINSGMFDDMTEGARTRGIQVQMCLDSFNGWNTTLFHNWHENPYNVANGGMLDRPIDYFTNSEARRLARQRYRYIVARWAYNPAILCWELWNEVDAVNGGGATFWGHETEVLNWHRDMANYIRSIDPFSHLITTSFADDGPREIYAMSWEVPEMEIVQVHQYHLILPQEHVGLIYDVRPFGKPVIMGEGNRNGVPGQDYTDNHGQSLHDLIWAAGVVESGAMSWWWDNWIYPHNLYGVLTPLVSFFDGEDWAPQNLEPLDATILSGHGTLEVYGSAGPLHAYIFFRDWSQSTVGLQIRLNQLAAADFNVEYWDAYTGTVFATQQVTGQTGGLVLNVPSFDRDIAVKVQSMAPRVQVVPASFNPTTIAGTNAPTDTFTISNAGFGTLSYNVEDDADWLSVTPTIGDVTSEVDDILVTYSTSELVVGTYPATITVTAPEAGNSPQTIAVMLTITSHPADFDGDGDIDQSDFGHLQACFSGTAPQDDPDCQNAKLNDDDNVDQGDRAIFQGCMSGANVPAAPDCAD